MDFATWLKQRNKENSMSPTATPIVSKPISWGLNLPSTNNVTPSTYANSTSPVPTGPDTGKIMAEIWRAPARTVGTVGITAGNTVLPGTFPTSIDMTTVPGGEFIFGDTPVKDFKTYGQGGVDILNEAGIRTSNTLAYPLAGLGVALDLTGMGGPIKNTTKTILPKLIHLVKNVDIQTVLKPLGLSDDATRELADGIRMINTETRMAQGARKVEIQNLIDDVMRNAARRAEETKRAFVQIINTQTGERVFYTVSPEDLTKLRQSGITNGQIGKNIVHTTTKTPAEMIERAGFRNGGDYSYQEIFEKLKPITQPRDEIGRFASNQTDREAFDLRMAKLEAEREIASKNGPILRGVQDVIQVKNGAVSTNELSKRALNSLENNKSGIRHEAISSQMDGGTLKNRAVEIRIVEDGTIDIVDGRHLLEAARKRGDKFVPIKDVTKDYFPHGVDLQNPPAYRHGKKIEDLGNKFTIKKAKNVLYNMFKQIVDVETVLGKDFKNEGAPAETFGRIVRLLAESKTADEFVVKHEGWHIFKRLLNDTKLAQLDDLERQFVKENPDIVNAIKERYPHLKGQQLNEEVMADEFAKWYTTGRGASFSNGAKMSVVIKNFFIKWANLIGEFFGKKRKLLTAYEQEFESIAKTLRLDGATENRYTKYFQGTKADTPAFSPLPKKQGDLPPEIEKSATKLEAIGQSLQSEKSQSPHLQNTISSPDSISNNDLVKKVVDLLKKAKPLLRKQDALYSAERSKRVAQIAKIGEEVPGKEGYFKQLSALKGELPRVDFENIEESITPESADQLFQLVQDSPILTVFEKITTKTGLLKVLSGRLPTRSELRLLNEVFPREFINAVLDKEPMSKKALEMITASINLPRAIMATADLSGALRQGVFLIGRPKQFIPAFRDMFKYAFDQRAYDGLMNRIQARPTYKYMREGGLSLTDMDKFVDTREEQFMSNLVEKIPIFGAISKGSNRAYTGFLNQLRADVFDDLWRGAKQLGLDKERPNVVKDIAKYVNSATGRGDLGIFNRAAPILNGIFFSPRLMASRLNLLNPLFYYKLDPFVRKEALKDLFTFASIAGTILTFAKLNGAEVETDPRNADFAKIKIDNTRYDVLGGFQQYIRLASQLLTGKIISSTTGKEITLGEGYKPLTRMDVLARFFQNKEAPVLSFVTALMQGQNSLGEKTSVPVEVLNRSMPLMVQDMYDLYQEWGPQGIAMGLPGILGIGSQTYGSQELVKGKNQIGQETAQLKPKKGIAESIAGFFGVEPDLSSTPGYAVSAYVDEMLALPKEEARQKFEEIKTENPKLAEKIVKELKDRELGITEHDKSIRAKGVENGDRAMAIAEELNNLKTKEEKAQLWSDYTKKKIITKDVAEQLLILLNKPE